MSDDRSYYEDRAEQELEAAESASNSSAATAHYRLAAYYLDRVHNPLAGEQADAKAAFDGMSADQAHLVPAADHNKRPAGQSALSAT